MHRGERVGKYRLTNGPVEGGRGAVWFAVDTELGRSVVLKRAKLESSSQSAFDELLAEARALARFSHPHVVTLFDAVRTGKDKRATFWLVMEHVKGGSLDVPVKLAPQHAAAVGAQIADALAALHAKGLVHCDVKPANIVITEDRVAKLADFGAAYRVDSSVTITPNGQLRLTPAYAAPEAFRGAPERATDVFSLGATLYTLITGTPPLRGPGQTVRIEALSPQVGPLGALLTDMLRPDPKSRPTAAAVHSALTGHAAGALDLATLPLERITKPLSVVDLPTEVQPPAPWHRTALPGRRGLLTAGAVAVVALAVGATVLWASGSGDGDETDAAAPSPSPSTSARTEPAFLGDPRTADPCALLDARVFPSYEDAQLDRYQGNFNRCDVLLREGRTDVVDVRVELDSDPLPEAEKRSTRGRVVVVEAPGEPKECLRTLAVSGAQGGSLRITAVARKPDKVKKDLCDSADAAVDYAVNQLNDGDIDRRSPAFASDSLAHEDACSLLDVAALGKLPGVDARNPEAGFGDWSCQWTSTTNDVEVDLQFDQGGLARGPKEERTRIGGREAVVLPDSEGDGSCRVELVHREYLGPDRVEGTERVALVAKGEGPKGFNHCALAKDLAKSAAESLSSR
ncbi:serine/threonine-protein kinase [Streptomyces sp. NA04227]|uniref:serine/threonine-protein kinase n=1 Tax=Streptomyces sp. NA04227 TaxID=2742136 RepID=UPI0020CA40E6|nr:serine/threonine-protein kinase [Streptomyces sp. NA04227]